MDPTLHALFAERLPKRWSEWTSTLARAAADGDLEAQRGIEALASLDVVVRVELEGGQAITLRWIDGQPTVVADTDVPILARVRFTRAFAQWLAEWLDHHPPVEPHLPPTVLGRLAEPTVLASLRRQPVVFELRVREVPNLGEVDVRTGIGDVDLATPPRFTIAIAYADLRTATGEPWDAQRALVEGKLQLLGDVGAAMQLALAVL